MLKDLELPNHVLPGITPTYSVGVGDYRAAPHEDCDYLLARLVDWLNGPTFKPLSPDLEIAFALVKAVMAHLYLAWIHPFGDGNGRTARLMEVQILLAAGVSTPAAHLLSNHYSQTRSEYYRQLDRASGSGGDVLPFLQYAVRGFVDGLRGHLTPIREQQLDVAWQSYIHEKFDGAKSAADLRRRHLIVDLSRHAPVPLGALWEVSPRIAADYATLSYRTLLRDVEKLLHDKLVTATKDGVIAANKELIQAFLPIRHTASPIGFAQAETLVTAPGDAEQLDLPETVSTT